jgi:hypothetical protein
VIDWIKQLIAGSGSRELSLIVTADHVELTATHLVLGLKLDWRNRTNTPIPIKEVQVMMYLHGQNKEPLRFYPLERFERVLGQRALQKTPVRPFTLPPKEIYTEHLRFLSQEVLDIPPGNYGVDVHLKDISNISYTSRTKIQLASKIKYRRSEEWHED